MFLLGDNRRDAPSGHMPLPSTDVEVVAYSPSWTHIRHVASRHRLAGAAALGVELIDIVILPYPK